MHVQRVNESTTIKAWDRENSFQGTSALCTLGVPRICLSAHTAHTWRLLPVWCVHTGQCLNILPMAGISFKHRDKHHCCPRPVYRERKTDVHAHVLWSDAGE